MKLSNGIEAFMVSDTPPIANDAEVNEISKLAACSISVGVACVSTPQFPEGTKNFLFAFLVVTTIHPIYNRACNTF